MIKKLALLFAVLALVAAACSSDSSDDDTTTTTAASGGGGDTGQTTTSGSTLDEVIARGKLNCGVSGTAIGFSETQPDGSTTGFDADYCRSLAAAVLGDATAVEFTALTAAQRFEALNSGAVDVLFRNTTWTQDRDTTIGGDFGPTTFYDGQQMMGDPARLSSLNDDSGFEALDGAIVCTNVGTTTEKNISEGAAVAGVAITLEATETIPDAMDKFIAGTCDIVTTDGSGLFGQRSSHTAQGTPGAEAWVIFPRAPISKEPLGPMYRQNDSKWADAINWLVYATFIADENDVTSANIDSTMNNTPELTRLFGGEGEHQTVMGLSADAFYQAIKQTGNYAEIYSRNLDPLKLFREGTFNDQWFKGGLIYAPPAR